MNTTDLKFKRKALHLSQADVAAKLGITQPIYSLIETGKRPLTDYLSKLIAIFGGVSTAPIEALPVATVSAPSVAAPVEPVKVSSEKPFDFAPYLNAQVGSRVRLGEVVGEVRDFEHSGVPRFVVSVNGARSLNVWPVSACVKE